MTTPDHPVGAGQAVKLLRIPPPLHPSLSRRKKFDGPVFKVSAIALTAEKTKFHGIV